jgi:site-specific DNA recombinase
VLDARGASFVSVTQAFNTTTSMGRLTLNVLLSFAQFEREVTGERIRDKIAASKKKGMWMGGPVPLGYRVEERKLLVDETEAVVVRHIFNHYVALGTGRALIEELRADGYRTRVRPRSKGGPPIGGVPFERGMLFSMLANRIYLGEIVHKGTGQPGEHDAIVEQSLWDAVQQLLQANRVSRKERHNARIPSLLAGRLFDSQDRRMSPSHAVKSGKRYRYYITHASELRDGGPDACRLPASDIETLVVERLRALLTDRSAIARLGDLDARASSAAIDIAAIAAAKLDTAYGRTSLVGRLVVAVRLGDSEVGITIDRDALRTMVGIEYDPATIETPLVITSSAVRVRHGKDVKLVLAVDSDTAAARDPQLLELLAEARDARDAVLAAPDKSIKEIARADGQCRTRMARLVRLSWLAPEIVKAIVEGRHPARLTPRTLLTADLPIDWRAQKALLGIR